MTTRYFNVFGPRQDPGSPYSGVISLFIKALSERTQPINLRRRRADPRLHLRLERRRRGPGAAGTPGVGGEVFNIATSSRTSLNELLATLKKIFGSTVEPIYQEARTGDVRDSQADITKATKLLGYTPAVGLQEGLRKTVDWYQTPNV